MIVVLTVANNGAKATDEPSCLTVPTAAFEKIPPRLKHGLERRVREWARERTSGTFRESQNQATCVLVKQYSIMHNATLCLPEPAGHLPAPQDQKNKKNEGGGLQPFN